MLYREIYRIFDTAICAMICNDIALRDRLEIALHDIMILEPDDLPPDNEKNLIELVEMNESFRYGDITSNFESELAHAIFQLFKNLISATGNDQSIGRNLY